MLYGLCISSNHPPLKKKIKKEENKNAKQTTNDGLEMQKKIGEQKILKKIKCQFLLPMNTDFTQCKTKN